MAPTDPPDAEKVPVTTDTPFCAYSAAKAITTTVVHMLVERGHFSLDDRVCDYLPTYTSHGKDRTTIRHVMTHSAGVPIYRGPRADLKRMDDSEYTREQLGALKPLYRPGLVHIYHGLTWGPLMREIVSAATGRNIREILATEILDPLGFRWTNYGVAPQDVPLVAPSHATGKPMPAPMEKVFSLAVGGSMHKIIPFSNSPQYLTSVLPSSNTISTANELSRFAEILRRGGELDGVRVVKPETLSAAVEGVQAAAPRRGHRSGAAALGHRIHAGLQQIRPVRPRRARRLRPHRPESTSRCGPTPSVAWLPVSSAAASRAAIARPSVIRR